MRTDLIIYHYSKCKKSRAGLDYVRNLCPDPEVVNYIEEGLTVQKIKDLLSKLRMPAEELVRKQEDYYRDFLKHQELSEDDLIRILAENPKLIRRPIVVSGEKAVIADPPENINILLTSSVK